MASEFIKDIIPFMIDKEVTYIDVGANQGDTFAEFHNSNLHIKEAHLFEPNNITFKLLQEKCQNKYPHAHIYNLALSSECSSNMILLQKGTMSRIIPTELATKEQLSKTQLTASSTLDIVSQNILSDHISILKIDVEGHELDVMKGMVNLLSAKKIDVIYIEAGLDKNNTQQTYYRTIEDFLSDYDFKIFKIYEQINEWPTDSPFLRRINIAFMSKEFAENHPYKHTRAVYEFQNRLLSLVGELKKARTISGQLQKQIENVENQINALKSRKKP